MHIWHDDVRFWCILSSIVCVGAGWLTLLAKIGIGRGVGIWRPF